MNVIWAYYISHVVTVTRPTRVSCITSMLLITPLPWPHRIVNWPFGGSLIDRRSDQSLCGIYNFCPTNQSDKEIMIINNNNLLHLYSAFLGTQSALHGRGNLLYHHQCAASTWMMWRQPYCARTPTTHQLTGGEETEWWSQSADWQNRSPCWKKTIDTITTFFMVLLVIMGPVLVFMETLMDLVGLYW